MFHKSFPISNNVILMNDYLFVKYENEKIYHIDEYKI